MKVKERKRYTDGLIALVLTLIVFLLGFFYLDNTCYLGDDFAAYISEGIAIAEGTVEEQMKLNARMIVEPVSDDIMRNGLMYVWGYPLLLALVYKLVGFDRVTFSTIIYYKLPSLILFSIMAGVFYLFLRRRFGWKLSSMLTVIFCTTNFWFDYIDALYSDIVFLPMVVIALLLIELHVEAHGKAQRLLMSIALGFVLWFAYETRRNGVSLLFAAAAAQVISFIQAQKKPEKDEIIHAVFPLFVFILLKLASEVFLPAATNYGEINFTLFFTNIKYYFNLIIHWLGLTIINPFYAFANRFVSVDYDKLMAVKTAIGYLSFAICAVGIAVAWHGKNLYLSLFIIVYYIGVCMFPHQQGMRYIFPLFPIFMMFFGYGLYTAHGFVTKRLSRFHVREYTRVCVCVLISLFFVFPMADVDRSLNIWLEKEDIENYLDEMYRYNIYSKRHIELYNYIRNETPEDCTIGAIKTRALYLNTERLSPAVGVNGCELSDLDYYLTFYNNDDDLLPTLEAEFKPIYVNGEFTLYKRIE